MDRIKRKPLNTSQLIALVFAGIILLGTVLLSLPFASRTGESCGIRIALFTATSATCVTGLVLRDTWTQWSAFGQIVILCLIEVGGLGFMSIASLIIFALRRKTNMNQRMIIAQSFGVENTGDAVRLQKRMLRGCLVVQGSGAVLLTLRFAPVYGWFKAIRLGVFHAVSAFCNAGFDILGFELPNSSVSVYGTDPVVCLVLAALIIVGGFGYVVWDEVIRVRRFRRMSVYTRLVLLTTTVLVLSGTLLILASEWSNPGTLGNMNGWQKVLASFFQSATLRTAGFAGIDQGALSEGGKAISMFYMLIGGCSGSTAGGLKVVTFLTMVLFLRARILGREDTTVFNRTIPDESVLNAVTLFGVMLVLAFFGGTFICIDSSVPFIDALYEAISALATVGLTTGITPGLALPSHLLLILFMYFGRVGILTLSLGFLQGRRVKSKYKYAETELLIG